MPAGSFAKAALVGAKTVNGPGPDRVSTRPAAFTAVTSVDRSGTPTAVATMLAVGAASAGRAVVVIAEAAMANRAALTVLLRMAVGSWNIGYPL